MGHLLQNASNNKKHNGLSENLAVPKGVPGASPWDTSRDTSIQLLARELPAEELPDFIGRLESAKAIAYSRLMAPSVPQEHDELLSVEVAAERLGVSKDYLYRHSQEYPFTRRQGRKLLFLSSGVEKHIRQQRA